MLDDRSRWMRRMTSRQRTPAAAGWLLKLNELVFQSYCYCRCRQCSWLLKRLWWLGAIARWLLFSFTNLSIYEMNARRWVIISIISWISNLSATTTKLADLKSLNRWRILSAVDITTIKNVMYLRGVAVFVWLELVHYFVALNISLILKKWEGHTFRCSRCSENLLPFVQRTNFLAKSMRKTNFWVTIKRSLLV